MNCPVCGKRMSRFENPTRYVCSNQGAHPAIEASSRQRRGGWPKGKRKPGQKPPRRK